MRYRHIILCMTMFLVALGAQAQIVIGGNVYGGGNEGDTGGSTTVTVHAGNLKGSVFGGARIARVGGSAFVDIDGAHASDYILIDRVYGGNDISGAIGTSNELPTALTETTENHITTDWNAFVRISTKMNGAAEAEDAKPIYIGQLFGGGNGDYDYDLVSGPYHGLAKPVVDKVYLEILGGSIVYAYGGGNNATVRENTVICVDNPSKVVNSIKDTRVTTFGEGELLTTDRFKAMGINTGFSNPSSDAFQIGRFFGGNNKAEMAIQPTWNLKDGKIRNLYSGGNQGAMTHKEGLLLEIMADSKIQVDNLYGGCRMADVKPLKSGTLKSGVYQATPLVEIQLHDAEGNQLYNFPSGLSARVLIRGGDINNVYGGNDITGDVTGGNAIGVYSSIRGDLYGGGNGSYPYTDNAKLIGDDIYGDLYYWVPDVKTSVEALNDFRPNSEAVSIRLIGTEEKPTIIGGAIYCGGNSATIRNDDPAIDAYAELKIGSYVIADKVFLGNNGENMVKYNEVEKDERDNITKQEGVLKTFKRTVEGSSKPFNSMNLNNETQFAQYMEGVAMRVRPRVVFDNVGTYVPYSTWFGSFFCGGNVGSIDIDGAIEISFNDKVVVFDKVVGGSNEANVYQSAYNAQYLGGLLGAPDAETGNKLVLNFGGLRIQPKRWIKSGDDYVLDANGNRQLEWNTVDSRSYNPETKKYTPMASVTTAKPFEELDLYRRFQGGNVYGGCYNNGHVNGNVVINLDSTLVDRKGPNAVFDQVEEEEGEAKLYGIDTYNITERKSGVLLSQQGMDPLGRGLNVFGGGYGGDSEIWGSTTINLRSGYTFQIFGGGEQGAIGNAVSHSPDPDNPTVHNLTYNYNENYSTCINLGTSTSPVGTFREDADDRDGVVDDPDMAECEFIYGGSFEGLIAGNTRINLGNGRIFNSFAGSCNADILGHTETYVGLNSNTDNDFGFPWIRDHIYGGNDLGGQILNVNHSTFENRVSSDIRNKVYNPTSADHPKVLEASAYIEYLQGHVENIFGGCYGDYDYTDSHYDNYTNADGQPLEGFNKPWMDNAFVNFKPKSHTRNAVARIFGAGQGHAYEHASDADRDKMQDRSYVLIDDAQNMSNTIEVFGGGDYSGVGMGVAKDVAQANADGVTAAAVIDLMRGHLKDAYGASYQEGVTRRTIVNVPAGSTIQMNRIFGGAYGLSNLKVCDAYETNVNYHSGNAVMLGYNIPEDRDKDGNLLSGGIYGGNNNARRTLYARINIDAPVSNGVGNYTNKVFGAGYGQNTWAEYTEINLNAGASVYEVYGGGYGGMVLNEPSLEASGLSRDLSNGYTDEGLNGYLVRPNGLDLKTNTNVYINQGAYVAGYCYGGGLGADATVSGTTYIGLHGGEVSKDMYGGGWGGAVCDQYGVAKDENLANDFVATTNVFVEGGTLRNVYGGGYQGSVGKHEGAMVNGKFLSIAGPVADDILGKTNVVIGIREDQATLPDGYGFYKGVPAIQRNAYSGGEGGAVFGEAHLTMNNGYVGYVYLLANEMLNEQGKKVVNPNPPAGATARYEAKIDDDTYWENNVWKGKDRLKDYGNLFGGGYDDLSCTDESFVTMWGGTVRSSVHGGGEIATIGRGVIIESGENNEVRELLADNFFKEGKTHIKMYNGKVLRNVFGGGKGYNINGYGTGAHKLYTDGYVFGQTEVLIHGGEIGTAEGVAVQTDGTGGYGNVFGGGDVGYVYSRSFFTTPQTQANNTGSPNHFYYKDANGKLTEDCKVVIAPMLQLKPGKTASYKDVEYGAYDYVPTEYLNTLPAAKTDTRWTDLFTGDKNANGTVNPDDPVERGIVIHNAVFAGGNVSSNSESYANAITVFGNTTATLYDVYHRDFITVGTEHTGGLYGGGNLSVVGGYRELNITNYGTDYYGMDDQISLEKYQTLTNRERAYFKLEYVCQQDVEINDKPYTVGYRISEDEYNALPNEYKTEYYWKQYGFCSIYAGRLLNTIQRADFCGVFGSRLVLQGAKDRVADVADGTEYTINRIGELSLNQQRFTPNSDAEIHGNYFGIYSIVNYLGNLTSDVRFVADNRRYVDGGLVKEDTKTYYNWKIEHLNKRDRNNGTSYNQVALASGVYLELTSENSTPSHKIYGDITGVVELDLINVKKDIEGGGYVYARNEHGQWTEVSHENTLLSLYNMKDGDEALTKKIYTYSTTDLKAWQTSGNFIHKSKRIVDDCYPNNGVYQDDKGVYVTSPAHYWFIKGEVYIYDQTVSAYAGSATAYRKEVKIPLTITAGSNGKLKLLNIQPNLYAYYADEGRSSQITSDGVTVDNERVTFHLNDVISWWDWHQLADNEKKYFVKDTYINVDSCTIGGTPYSAGTYVLENDPSVHGGNANQTAYQQFLTTHPEVKDSKGETVTDLTKLFRSSNNISHQTGYVLTFDMNSPKDWDDWYTPITGNISDKIRKENYTNLSASVQANYREGPTYRLKSDKPSGLYGQRNYAVGEIISKEIYDDYENTVTLMTEPPTGQASVEPAYVALNNVGNIQAGNAVPQSEGQGNANFEPAKVCTNTIQLGDEEYILLGELVSGTETNITALATKYMNYNNSKINADQITLDQARTYINDNLSNAYYIKTAGLYGGQYFETGVNYSALKAWCDLTESRNKFDFNYDALDVLIDSDYHGEGSTETYYKSPYSDEKPVEYQAYYTGGQNGDDHLTYTDGNSQSHTLDGGDLISREDYENYIKNEQLHYTRIQVEKGSDTQTFYIVKENIISNGTPYAKGQDISEKDYNSLPETIRQAKVATVTLQKDPNNALVKYYCYETYTPSTSFSTESGSAGSVGSIISATVFSNDIPNDQKYFTIQGAEPTETTTLYVSRESNAKDVMSDKIISVVYQYSYYEADDEGDGVSLVNELHVVNIHLKLESGAPEIGPLTAPSAVIPGSTVGLKAPSVNPGLYEVLTSGWEIFANEDDAALHRNGKTFINNGTPLYWYQNQKVFLAFYSNTYLGKTYSNYVPLTVANYHDLDAVMADKEHHLYVDHPDVDHNSKIYIDNRDCESDQTKSELDLLKDFFDLTLTPTGGHAALDTHVRGGADLDFILNSDVSPKAYTSWTPIGNETQCFAGTLHGDGYTISGLDHSLFGKLCGNVYNLGVTGSFTGAGVVDTGDGYVENCWINTTGTPDGTVKAVFGNPTRSSGTQIVNCYYPDTKNYSTTNNGRGLATQMDETAFYNGTVAYNLNSFYLNKRYYDGKNQATGTEYHYFGPDANGTLTDKTGHYPEFTAEVAQYGNIGYVENRYKDGDFIYANGSMSDAGNNRMRLVQDGLQTTVTYAPIWPDDYLFFGQMLTYGHGSADHEDHPSHITTDNRVYRAPAYYRSKEMGVAHFNPRAYLAAYSAPTSTTDNNLKEAYPGMTAIDFKGHQDGAYARGLDGTWFYPPLLDDGGITYIVNKGETANLLVYAPSEEANEQTYNTLNGYFTDPAYSTFYDANDQYRRVLVAPTGVPGHLVQSNLKATSDHLLVDEQDFNCPIAYSFDDSHRMWYQRLPKNFVSGAEGWETVSIPFEAELVSTQDKGEITHFYQGSATGHEYWLREYQGGTVEDNILKATFAKPTAGTVTKNYTNTFLWDYYYSKDSQRDVNEDQYQTYYKDGQTYPNYPRESAGVPYLIGFPGATYYEFDLSGTWTPEHRYLDQTIASPGKQTVSFVSEQGISIPVSDDENKHKTEDGFTFRTNYLNKPVRPQASESFVLDAKGESFAKSVKADQPDTLNVSAFRPYFVKATSSARTRTTGQSVEKITFGIDDSNMGMVDYSDPREGIKESVRIYAKEHQVIVESSLRRTTDVRIINTAGILIRKFTLEPGETKEVTMNTGGVYIVKTTDGRYLKKLIVK